MVPYRLCLAISRIFLCVCVFSSTDLSSSCCLFFPRSAVSSRLQLCVSRVSLELSHLPDPFRLPCNLTAFPHPRPLACLRTSTPLSNLRPLACPTDLDASLKPSTTRQPHGPRRLSPTFDHSPAPRTYELAPPPPGRLHFSLNTHLQQPLVIFI